ncbi:MAG TPA: hypothetical protein VMT76_01290 [Puia sp.]|nr:hypothetical protein [Puia sp.]
MDKDQKQKTPIAFSGKNADTSLLLAKIKSDSLYQVEKVMFRDSAVLIAVNNPDKSGTEIYFDKKYKLNGYDNINMVYIFQYDSLKPLQSVSLEEAIMAKGKKMGRFQEQWENRFIDTTDGSCRPLKKFIQLSIKNPLSFKNELTTYQPESIYKMHVLCKYIYTDSSGAKIINNISALVDTSGNVSAVEKIQ